MKFNEFEEQALIDWIKKANKKDHSIVRSKESIIKNEITPDKKVMQGVRLTIDFLDEMEYSEFVAFLDL